MQRLTTENCPLGGPEAWSATLRCALGIVLPSRAQILLLWGEDYVSLYNDAFAVAIGGKHPRAMGRPVREHYGEVWDTLAPLLERVRRTGETVLAEDHRFLIDRHGYLEEVFFDISYSAVHEGGRVGGVMCVVTETTGRVLADRRLRALRALGLRVSQEGDVEAACAAALETIVAENPLDHPWGRILLAGETSLSVAASHGEPPDGLPPVALAAAAEAVLRDATPRDAPGVLALPLMAGGTVAGVFLAGLSPHLRLAGDYGNYLGVAAGQISLAITRLRQEAEDRRAAALLRESEARFRNMADHVPVMVWISEGDGRCSYVSQRWYDFTGQTPATALGLGWQDAVHPEDRGAIAEAAARATKRVTPFQMEYRLRAADGHYAWVIDAAVPRLDDEGRFAGFIGSVLDISDRRRAEEARDLLARELSHRIKNVFMVTGGLAALSARGDPAAEAFAARLQERLRALSLAHDLGRMGEMPGPEGRVLTAHGLIHALLAPYGDTQGRVSVEGEDRPLGYAAASTLALVLHEQATNAVKYGALSSPAGRLQIVTQVQEGGFCLDWVETGGPPAKGPPRRHGFGTMLAARSLSGVFQGRMVHDWKPEGLVIKLEVAERSLAL
jgi:PAS domain S-box-containing protein